MKYLFLFLALALTLASCKVNKNIPKGYDNEEDLPKRYAYSILMKKCIEKYVGKDTMDFSVAYNYDMFYIENSDVRVEKDIHKKIDSLTDNELAIIDDHRSYSNVSEIALGKTAYIDFCLDFYKSKELDSLCKRWIKDLKKSVKKNRRENRK